MATARSIVFTAGGKSQEAKDADTQLVSATIQNNSGSLTVNAQATSLILQVAGSTVCTLTSGILTVPRVYSDVDLQLNAATGQVVKVEVNTTAVLTISASAITAAQPLAMGSNKITGLATATANGDALCYPWLTANYNSASLGSTFNITGSSGVFQDTGLSISLPNAGVFLVIAEIRSVVSVATGPGGFIVLELVNATDASVISGSQRIGAYTPITSSQQYAATSISEIIVVAAAKTINVYASRNTGTTYNISALISDSTNGLCRIKYIQIG